MGWAVGYDSNWKRDIGYGVPCVCDHPGCKEKIDRGLAYVCGGEPYGGDRGCGLYFCSKHRGNHSPYTIDADGEEIEDENWADVCERCAAGQAPFEAKPDVRRWINHKLTDPTWATWRKENPEFVAKHKRPKPTREAAVKKAAEREE